MTLFLVSYDLRSGTSPARLEARLREFQPVDRPLANVWILKAAVSARQIRELLLPEIGDGDGLVIWELGPDRALSGHDAEARRGLWGVLPERSPAAALPV